MLNRELKVIEIMGDNMGVEFLRARQEDYEDLVESINYVFSNDGEETEFRSLLPKL